MRHLQISTRTGTRPFHASFGTYPIYDLALEPGPVRYGPVEYNLVNFPMAARTMSTLEGFLSGEIPI
jgi:hypothetical protein